MGPRRSGSDLLLLSGLPKTARLANDGVELGDRIRRNVRRDPFEAGRMGRGEQRNYFSRGAGGDRRIPRLCSPDKKAGGRTERMDALADLLRVHDLSLRHGARGAKPAMNENAPSTFAKLAGYINRDQYGSM